MYRMTPFLLKGKTKPSACVCGCVLVGIPTPPTAGVCRQLPVAHLCRPLAKERQVFSLLSLPGPSTLVTRNMNRTKLERSRSRASPRHRRALGKGGCQQPLPEASGTRVSGSKAVDTESASNFPAWFRFWLLTLSARDETGAISYKSVNKSMMMVATVNDALNGSGSGGGVLGNTQGMLPATIASPFKPLKRERQKVPLPPNFCCRQSHPAHTWGRGLNLGCGRLALRSAGPSSGSCASDREKSRILGTV